MGYVISSKGKTVVTLNIDVSIYEDNGNIKVTTYTMKPGTRYEMIVLSRKDCMLYTVTGTYSHFGSNSPCCGPHADWIMLDCSNEDGNHRAKLCKIMIKDIKAIKEIVDV